MNKRGFSSIIGAVFMILIAWSLASAYFFFTLSQNTNYNNAVKQMGQLYAEKTAEGGIAANTTYAVYTNGMVSVNTQLSNSGPSAINFTTLWVQATSSDGAVNYNCKTINLVVAGGESIGETFDVPVSNVAIQGKYSYASWLITARGNTVVLAPLKTQEIVVAQTAQGIGSISFNFGQFWHYDFSSEPAQGTALPSQNPQNYTISEGQYNVFHVALTNLDPDGQSIILNGNSSIYIIGQHSGTVKYATWSLVNVTNNKIYPSSSVQYTVPFGASVGLYFANSIGGIDTNNAYPLNILLCGLKGENDYGQNIPFVSIFLTN